MNVKTVITRGIFLALIVLNFIVDVFEVFINFISLTGFGLILQFLNYMLDLVVTGITTISLFLLGGKFVNRRLAIQIAGQLAELMPLADILPIRTLTILINMILYSREESAEIQQEKSEKQESVEGTQE